MKYRNTNNWALFSAVLFTLAFSACKKDKAGPDPIGEPPITETNTKQTPTTNRMELSNDSLFLYAKEIYFWNETLPSYDTYEPRKYKTESSTLDNLENNLFNLVKASGTPDFVSQTSPLRFSYISDITTDNPEPVATMPNTEASVDLEGNGNDIGIRPVFYLTNSQTRSYLLFITAVYKGSDGDIKGLKRGWAISKINGEAIGTNYENERLSVMSKLSGNSVSLEGVKYVNGVRGDNFSITVNKTSYKSSPIYASKTFTAGSTVVGYFAYARFSNSSNSVEALNTMFSDFVAKGVTDLVVDLRYNGGGYVSTAEYLTNLIAPSSATGVMFAEHYNNKLKNRKVGAPSILSNQPLLDANDKLRYDANKKLITYADIDYSVAENTTEFKKIGALTGLRNVVFIVSGNTASASELVINNLKPKMNVKLVGATTYGKPVGFFPIRLENRYDVYYSLFETKNSLGQGGYYTGMVPDFPETDDEPAFFDDPRYDFGDKQEPYLAKAIKVLNPSSLPVIGRAKISALGGKSGEPVVSASAEIRPVNQNSEFVGMIEDRTKLRK